MSLTFEATVKIKLILPYPKKIDRMNEPKFVEIWRRETENWEIVEYEKMPGALCCNVNHKGSDVSFHFGRLGVSYEIMESVDNELLDSLLTIMGNVAVASGWNVSVSSFWSNLPYCIPDLDDYEDEDDVDPEVLETLQQIWEFIQQE